VGIAAKSLRLTAARRDLVSHARLLTERSSRVAVARKRPSVGIGNPGALADNLLQVDELIALPQTLGRFRSANKHDLFYGPRIQQAAVQNMSSSLVNRHKALRYCHPVDLNALHLHRFACDGLAYATDVPRRRLLSPGGAINGCLSS
jgi:hypothetical protein